MLDITDGKSSTFLFVEKSNYFNQSYSTPTASANHFIFVHHPSQGYVTADFGMDVDTFNNRAPQSFHTGGVQARWRTATSSSPTTSTRRPTRAVHPGRHDIVNPHNPENRLEAGRPRRLCRHRDVQFGAYRFIPCRALFDTASAWCFCPPQSF